MPQPETIKDVLSRVSAQLLGTSAPSPDQRAAQTISQAALDAGSPIEYTYNPQTEKFDIVIGGQAFEASPEEAAMIIGTATAKK